MPEFSVPFGVKKSDRKLNHDELVRAIRFSIASEYEAIQIYEEIAESIDDEKAQKILNEVANDERVHVGNLSYLLNQLSPKDEKSIKEGIDEAKKIMSEQ